jgi:methionyl-tRNA formyltransferase
VTNPDRPAGRKLEVQESPVKIAARAAGLDVLQPASARDPDLSDWLGAVRPDVAVVVAYGRILPGELLSVPRLGFVNVHFSLLPLYRGAAPVHRAVMDGVDETGVTLIVLNEKMDEGPVLATERTPVGPDETAGSVGERLAHIGARMLVPTLLGYADGSIEPVPQDHERATYAPKLTAEDARVDWTRRAVEIRNQVRGLNPSPGAWTYFRSARLKLFAVEVVARSGVEPGVVADDARLVVGTGEGALHLVDAQLAGKRRMTGQELARGLRPRAGESLG